MLRAQRSSPELTYPPPQYADGLFGALLVKEQPDPNAALYNTEWTIIPADFYNKSVIDLVKDYLSPLNPDGIEPLPSAITVNGVRDGRVRYQAKRTDKVRVRVINAGAFTLFNVSVDGMVLKIIELDGQDVEPIEVSWFLLSTAQRASFVLDFSQLRTLPKAMASSSSIYMRFLAAEEMYVP